MPLPPPRPPGAHSPPRRLPVEKSAISGWDERRVVETLGPPDKREAGRVWFSSETQSTWWRDDAGRVVPIAVFGSVPRSIPVGKEYVTLHYRNVVGATGDDALNWLVHIREGRVVEVGSHPVGAVF